MKNNWTSTINQFAIVFFASLLCGCGGGSSGTPESAVAATAADATTASRPAETSTPFVPPVASIELPNLTTETQTTVAESNEEFVPPPVESKDIEVETIASAALEEGSAAWLIREITRLRTAPTDVITQPDPQDATKTVEIKLDSERATQIQLNRLSHIIELSQQVIGKTHNVPEEETLFNNAVHYLADARMQLVLAGDQEQAKLLVEDADALFKRDPESFAAIESSYKVVQLTQSQAERFAASDPKWAKAFGMQSRLFAERFPQESSRACVNLIAAARLCDNLGESTAALSCLQVVEQTYGDTPYAQQIAGILRRLRLTGTSLSEFGGSTHDGGFLNISQYRGRTVIIAFWASNSEHFQRDLPRLQQVVEQYPNRVAAIGVNLDKDELAVDRFLEQTGNSWKHIFFSDPQKRGARNVVAQHYGVIRVPTYWVVDAQGIVKSIDASPTTIEQLVASTLAKSEVR